MWLDDAPVLSADGGHFAYTSFDEEASAGEDGIQIQVRDVAVPPSQVLALTLG